MYQFPDIEHDIFVGEIIDEEAQFLKLKPCDCCWNKVYHAIEMMQYRSAALGHFPQLGFVALCTRTTPELINVKATTSFIFSIRIFAPIHRDNSGCTPVASPSMPL